MSTNEYGASRTAPTGWDERTAFSVGDAAAEQALRARRQPAGKHLRLFGQVMAADAGAGHGCPGQLFTDLYFSGADAHWHVGVSVWYPCESHLEILGDVVIP